MWTDFKKYVNSILLSTNPRPSRLGEVDLAERCRTRQAILDCEPNLELQVRSNQ